MVAKSGRNTDEFALHSLLTRAATTLAAGEDMAERVIQRQGRWGSDAYKAYTRNDIGDPSRVSRKLAKAKCGEGRDSWGKEQSGVRHN